MRTRNTHFDSSESGATIVQAAIVLPLFLAVLLGSIRILLICYQGIRLQYEVSETMRMTFTLDSAGRGGLTWANYFANTFRPRARATGVNIKFSPQSGMIDINNYELSYTNSQGNTVQGWPDANALPGGTFSLTIKSNEPLLPKGLVSNTSPLAITLRAKAVAVIHRTQGE